jgi:hypothetical protein
MEILNETQVSVLLLTDSEQTKIVNVTANFPFDWLQFIQVT